MRQPALLTFVGAVYRKAASKSCAANSCRLRLVGMRRRGASSLFTRRAWLWYISRHWLRWQERQETLGQECQRSAPGRRDGPHDLLLRETGPRPRARERRATLANVSTCTCNHEVLLCRAVVFLMIRHKAALTVDLLRAWRHTMPLAVVHLREVCARWWCSEVSRPVARLSFLAARLLALRYTSVGSSTNASVRGIACGVSVGAGQQ